MKKIFLLLSAAFSLYANAQLTNNGATIYVQAGGLIYSQGTITNSSGTIDNNGKIQTAGNFSNTGSYISATSDDSLIFVGSGNATLNTGTAVLTNLSIEKTNAADEVKLAASATVNSKFNLTNGKFTTDPIANPLYVLSSPATAAYTFAGGKEIIGSVQRTGWTAGAARVFNQPNMLVTTAAGTSPTVMKVTMIPQADGGDPAQTEREVKRFFRITATGGSAYTADIRYPYTGSELNTNNEVNLVPWNLITGEWNSRTVNVTRDAANDWVNITGVAATDLTNEFKLADPRYTFNLTALMRGAWNGTSAMTTNLNSGALLPLTQPYTVTPFSYAGGESVASITNPNIVDWVLVELRKPSTNTAADANSTTIVGRKAGFVLNNGSIVDVSDQSSAISFDISKQGPSYVTVRHRNHLGVINNNPGLSAPSGLFANDFTVLGNNFKPAGAASDPVVLLAGAGGKYGMWAGDASRTGAVNGTDISLIKVAIAGSQAGYLFTDINLTGTVNGTDVSLTKATISSSGEGGVSGRTGPKHTAIPGGETQDN